MNAVDSAQLFQYPETMRVYGIIVNSDASNALIKVALERLHTVGGDMLVFLCFEDDDVRRRVGWEDLQSNIRFRNGTRNYEVKLLRTPEQLFDASLRMRIVHLPNNKVSIPT
jgi:hypothetical protein